MDGKCVREGHDEYKHRHNMTWAPAMTINEWNSYSLKQDILEAAYQVTHIHLGAQQGPHHVVEGVVWEHVLGLCVHLPSLVMLFYHKLSHVFNIKGHVT